MFPPVRWGVIGCARIARLEVVPAILRASNACLQAVASRDPERLSEFAAQFGPFTHHTRYEALIDDPEVDAIYLPLPNALHCEWTVRALAAGKHVLCEKPLALDAAQAEMMAATAKENGVWLMEAFMYRYTQRMRCVTDVLSRGVLGDIRSVNATFRFLLDRAGTIKEMPALGGGALYDVGCYPLDLIGLVSDAEPVSCKVERVMRHGVDVNLSALLRYESGLIASLHCGFDAFGHVRADIVGTRGRLEVTDTYLDDAGELVLYTESGRETLAVAASDRYCRQIEDFSAAIQENRPPKVDLAASLRTLRVLDRLRAAF